MILTKEAFEKLGTDEVKMRIAIDVGASYLTIRRWIKTNHSNLTKKAVIEAIMTHTGIEEDNIFKVQ